MLLKRQAMAFLKRWKDKKNRKPLVIKGARQVGKTWLMNLPLYAISLLYEIELLDFSKNH
jgi:predicted AAA+ superfamily ATPase